MRQDKIYNKVWEKTYEDNPRPFLEYKNELINKYLIKKNGRNALDIGCGDGFFTSKLLELGYMVDAIDISPEAIKSTRKRVETLGMENSVNLFNTEIEEFHPTQKYDVILCFEVLEHIKDDLNTLKKINEWIKNDGILIISVPHRQDLWNYSDEVGGHYRRYSKDELSKKLKIANFKVKKLFDYGFPFIRSFNHAIVVPNAKKANSEIISPKNNFTNRMISTILKKMCKLDTPFINNNKGITIISVAKKR
ncbi:MAG TPA: class I SAM-dependent methyltransferase [Methanobacterium sp.]|nr:class I SAM-dependent methyltransferase [Methanobacterium sp.]